MISPERATQIEKTAIRKGLRLERGNFEQTFSGELTLQDMLPNMEDAHGLLSSPLAAELYDSEFFSVYSAVYQDNVFFGPRLANLLNTARPKQQLKQNDHSLGRHGTLADWGEKDEKILNAHSIDLEPYWGEFMHYQKDLYMQAMATWTPKEISAHLEFRRNRLLRRDIAVKQLDQLVKQKLEDKNERLPVYWSLQTQLKEHAQQTGINLGSDDHENLNVEQISGLIASLPRKTRETIIDNGFLLPFYIVVDTQTRPDPNLVSDKYCHEGEGRQYLGNDKCKVFLSDSWIEVRLDPDGTVVELEREIHDYQDKGLIPHFAWAHVKNTGQRLYLSSQVPEWFREGLDSRSNTYLGLTVAKHFSQVEFLFKEKLSTRHRSQVMREAQIVMQASKRRSEIMPFFLRFEEFIKNHLQPA